MLILIMNSDQILILIWYLFLLTLLILVITRPGMQYALYYSIPITNINLNMIPIGI